MVQHNKNTLIIVCFKVYDSAVRKETWDFRLSSLDRKNLIIYVRVMMAYEHVVSSYELIKAHKN